jgi:Shedu protein SduA, C-terminal
VFDPPSLEPTSDSDEVSEEIVVDGMRRQIRLLVAKEPGRVKELKIERVSHNGNIENVLTLNREDTERLLNMLRLLDNIPVEGGSTVRLDDDLIRDLLSDPVGMRKAYRQAPDKFADLIAEDDSASDVIAIAHRRQQVADFRRLLNDPEFFSRRQETLNTSREGIWQKFIEANPWILGIGLSGQLLTSWDSDRLEQVVAGFSISAAGKRVDALLRTAGVFSMMVFAEIKHHETALLADRPYRPDCWALSTELSGGVAQVQQTVYRASMDIRERVFDTDKDGAETERATFIIRPRSFLIAGHLRNLGGAGGGVNIAKLRSFELYRRNLYEPEILTFDELLKRAEWALGEVEGDEP